LILMDTYAFYHLEETATFRPLFQVYHTSSSSQGQDELRPHRQNHPPAQALI
jgi:hypothetical protein